MAANLTPELAPEAIGLLCLGAVGSAGGARPNPCKLTGVKNGRYAVVKPNGHRREEVVELATLRLWVKGNHTIGPNAAKRAEQINSLAELQHDAKANELTRHPTREEVMADLQTGVNPLVLMRVSSGARDFNYVAGHIVAIKDGGMFLVRFLGTKHPPQAFQLEKLAVPTTLDLAKIEIGLLTRVFGLKGPLPGMMKDVLHEVAVEFEPVPPPEPEKPVAKKAEKPQPVPAPTPAPAISINPKPAVLDPGVEPPRSVGKRTGTGDWVIVDTGRHLFFAKDPKWAYGRWVKEVGLAKRYDNARSVGVALGKMTRHEGATPEVMSPERAIWLARMWYQPRRLPEPEQLSIPVSPPAPESAVNIQAGQPERREESAPVQLAKMAPPSSPAPVPTVGIDTSATIIALRRAILERGEAEALCLEARGNEARARAAYEAGQIR